MTHTELRAIILAVADGLAAKQKHHRAEVIRAGVLKHKFEENHDYGCS